MKQTNTSAGQTLVDFFNQLTAENIDTIDEVYATDVDFRDPVREFSGREELKKYLGGQYKNVISCQFKPIKIIDSGDDSSVEWLMLLRHKYLNLGKEIQLQGVSLVSADPETKKIVAHRDYFDLGAFVMKSLPGSEFVRGMLKKLEHIEKSF